MAARELPVALRAGAVRRTRAMHLLAQFRARTAVGPDDRHGVGRHAEVHEAVQVVEGAVDEAVVRGQLDLARRGVISMAIGAGLGIPTSTSQPASERLLLDMHVAESAHSQPGTCRVRV